MILPLLTSNAKPLHQKARPLEKINQETLSLIRDMIETKKAHQGIGLAANQVGVLKKIIITGGKDVPEMILFNPIITKKSEEKEEAEEACLSLPGLSGKVPRAKEIEVRAKQIILQNHRFTIKNICLKAKGLFARVLQHEIDHLEGILFPERVTNITTLKQIPLPYKIVFFGTPNFAVPILKSLISNHWNISLIVTEPDKPTGRRQLLSPPPVKTLGEKYQLLIYQPQNLSTLLPSLLNLQPDLIILAAYGKILPPEVLKIPQFGALCLHPSLLPQYRGPSPITTAILNGEKKTGVTLFLMDEKIDHGKILSKIELPIQNNDTTESLSLKLSSLASQLLISTLPDYLEGKIKPQKQNEKNATYTKMIKKEDGYIESVKFKTQNLKELQKIERKIRAFYPWPKVWTKINSKRVIIHQAHIEGNQLILDYVQPEGKKVMKYSEYLNGYPKIV